MGFGVGDKKINLVDSQSVLFLLDFHPLPFARNGSLFSCDLGQMAIGELTEWKGQDKHNMDKYINSTSK